jgi:hypothetical protein
LTSALARDGVDVGHAPTGGVSWRGRRGVAGLEIAAVDRDTWKLPTFRNSRGEAESPGDSVQQGEFRRFQLVSETWIGL